MDTKMSAGLLVYLFMILVTFMPSISFGFTNDTCSPIDEASIAICKVERKCTKGDVIVVIMANIHLEKNDTFWCSDLLKRAVEQVATIEWIFGKLNSNNYITGVNIGN